MEFDWEQTCGLAQMAMKYDMKKQLLASFVNKNAPTTQSLWDTHSPEISFWAWSKSSEMSGVSQWEVQRFKIVGPKSSLSGDSMTNVRVNSVHGQVNVGQNWQDASSVDCNGWLARIANGGLWFGRSCQRLHLKHQWYQHKPKMPAKHRKHLNWLILTSHIIDHNIGARLLVLRGSVKNQIMTDQPSHLVGWLQQLFSPSEPDRTQRQRHCVLIDIIQVRACANDPILYLPRSWKDKLRQTRRGTNSCVDTFNADLKGAHENYIFETVAILDQTELPTPSPSSEIWLSAGISSSSSYQWRNWWCMD